MEKKYITEEMNEHEQWYKDAHDMTAEALPGFIQNVSENYSHDVVTICHAMAAAALAAMATVNKSTEGDIGKGQQLKVLSLFLRKWADIEGPAKVISWYGLLNPESENQFKVIPKQVYEMLKKQAQYYLRELEKEKTPNLQLKSHLEKICEGDMPWGFRVE